MPIRMWFLTLVLGALGSSVAQTHTTGPRVLYDNRIPTPEPRLTEQERGRIQYLAGQAAALGLWTEGSDMTMEYCTGKDFTVMGVAPGAFTVKKTQQAAYLYTYCFNRPGDFQGLVIVQGRDIVAHYVFVDHLYEMYAAKDINLNGYSELVLSGAFTGTGSTEGWLDIAELRPTRRFIGTLNYDHPPQIYSSDCGGADTGWSSQVIRVIPGRVPRYTQQKITGKCNDERTATGIGPVRPLALKPLPTNWVNAPLK